MPPKDEDGYKEWDHWYAWKHMMEWREDPESRYEIGSEWMTQELEDTISRKLMPKAEQRPKKQFRRCYQLKLTGGNGFEYHSWKD